MWVPNAAKLRAHDCSSYSTARADMFAGVGQVGSQQRKANINLQFLKESPNDSFLCETSECHLLATHRPFYNPPIVHPPPPPFLAFVWILLCACLQVSKPHWEVGCRGVARQGSEPKILEFLRLFMLGLRRNYKRNQ